MDKVIAYVKKVPLLPAIAAIGMAMIFLRVFRVYDVLPAAFQRLFLAAVMAGFLYLISGSKTFERSLRQTGYVVSTLRLILIYSALMGARGSSCTIARMDGALLKGGWESLQHAFY